MLLNKVLSSTKRRQHYEFQTYLKKEKEKVLKNLNSVVHPNSEFQDYKFLRILGHGGYGQVYAAQNIYNEIRILNSVNFEFLISLECYFTNQCAVFMVLPLMEGGQFFKLLRKAHYFEENAAVFFAGQVVLALEYLQYMGILFRDLKPENILVDLKGYLKLIDFGFAKYIGQNYSYTLCGTPEYIAPEIWLGRGYNLSPDWWSLGILIYEMCNSVPPFTSRNHQLLYEKVLAGNIKWPRHFSLELKSLLQGLLQVKIDKRLGCQKNKAQDVKFHKWFSSLDWIALWNKKILPPVSLVIAEKKNECCIEDMNHFYEICNTYYSYDVENIDFSV